MKENCLDKSKENTQIEQDDNETEFEVAISKKTNKRRIVDHEITINEYTYTLTIEDFKKQPKKKNNFEFFTFIFYKYVFFFL